MAKKCITELIEEVKEDICDNYCKYPTQYQMEHEDSEEAFKGHCEDCKHFRKLPYHADTLGKCFQHTGFCPKGDWYCADYEPEERNNKK